MDSPPQPAETWHRRDVVITTVVLVVWLVLTLGSRPFAPILQGWVDSAEAYFGLDVSRGTEE